ncbi:hypothetical protein [Actinophytocola oryzae]|uniref:Uncharacterized protein n=1 Tax=Actinophytocola oryzae TaxID=502181 RepID=A0A4R7VF72_9PSEU|nr:hypothetical protein [Actinophytocola oryzae]TDV47854.1 hypothetical protein CLV71_10989 [Actinophytocola oryzae]
MTRVNRPDTLLTRLREIERRLRLLEGRGPAMTMASVSPPPPRPVPLTPARPRDWPGTDSPEWTDLVLTLAQPGEFRVVVDAVADTGASGEARVLVNGTPVGAGFAVGEWHVVDITVGEELSEVVVQARRTGGGGLVRVSATLV